MTHTENENEREREREREREKERARARASENKQAPEMSGDGWASRRPGAGYEEDETGG